MGCGASSDKGETIDGVKVIPGPTNDGAGKGSSAVSNIGSETEAEKSDNGSSAPAATQAKLNKDGKPVTLEDDSPPSSPGILPRSSPADPPTSPGRGTATANNATPIKQAVKKDSLLISSTKNKKRSSQEGPSPSHPTATPRTQEEENDDAIAAILKETEELDADLASTSKKGAAAKSNKKLTKKEKEHLAKQEKERKKREKKEREAEEKRLAEEKAAEVKREEKRLRKEAEAKEKEAEKEKQRQKDYEKEREKERELLALAKKRGSIATNASPRKPDGEEGDEEKIAHQWSNDKYANTGSTGGNGGAANVWSNEAPAAQPTGQTFTSWSVTSRSKAVPSSVPTAAKVEPLALPSWQSGFDPEKFRKAQVEHGAKTEAFHHHEEQETDNRHSAFNPSPFKASAAKNIVSSGGGGGSGSNMSPRPASKAHFSNEDEAYIDNLLSE